MATAGVPAAQEARGALEPVQQRPSVEQTVEQAFDEGHDADIPSDIGYVLDGAGEKKRRQSFAEQRRNSLARKRSRAHDAEKGPLTSGEEPAAKDEDESGTPSEDEANIVWWDGPDDPQNPSNWPTWRKWSNCALVSALTFVTPLASSIFAPGVPELMVEFHSDNDMLAAFVVSVYVLGFAAGPMLIAPLSEIYGRLPVYHICNVGFVAFIIGCALAPSLNILIVFRLLSGIFGSWYVLLPSSPIASLL